MGKESERESGPIIILFIPIIILFIHYEKYLALKTHMTDHYINKSLLWACHNTKL